MSRGVKQDAVRLGRRCRRCGEDAWRKEGPCYRCSPCARRRASAGDLRRRKADPVLALFEASRKRAVREGTPFFLTIDDVRALWPADGRCPVLGTPFRPQGTGQGPNMATLDRLNNAWGYEPGNVAVLSMAANRAKSTLRAHELERIAAWMRRHGLD